jgi:F-type H+-transporting ATPase subunit delta
VSASRALARRYGRAFLEVAGSQGRDATLALRDELRAFTAAVSGHPGLQEALRNPGLGAERRRRLVGAVAESAGASVILRRLVDLLATRDRLALLPDVADAFAEAVNAAHGVVSAEAISAVSLAEAERKALARALGETVELRTSVEPGLLGGVLVRLGGRTYDGTVRARLAALRRRLAAASPGSAGTG